MTKFYTNLRYFTLLYFRNETLFQHFLFEEPWTGTWTKVMFRCVLCNGGLVVMWLLIIEIVNLFWQLRPWSDILWVLVHLASGPPGIPVLKKQIFPRQRKNSRKFPFGKMLDFARSNTVLKLATFIFNWLISLENLIGSSWNSIKESPR